MLTFRVIVSTQHFPKASALNPEQGANATDSSADVSLNAIQESSLASTTEQSPATSCPCQPINKMIDLIKMKSKDYLRGSSCSLDGPRISLILMDAEHFRDLIPGWNYEGYVADQVDLSDNNSSYTCTELDMVHLIDSEQAETCSDLLTESCRMIEELKCPCYSLKDLIEKEENIADGSISIDTGNSCNSSSSPFGYIDPQGSATFSFDPSTGCVGPLETRDAALLTNEQKEHCQYLLENSCSHLDMAAIESRLSDYSSCADSKDYAFMGRDGKNCARWVSEDPDKRCKKKDEDSGKYVFEYCRQTCNKCARKDDPSFRLDKQHKDCVWISKNKDVRCRKPGALENCRKTCGTPSTCCMDNAEYTFLKWFTLKKARACSWARRKNTERRCNRRSSIALNCPETCGRC